MTHLIKLLSDRFKDFTFSNDNEGHIFGGQNIDTIELRTANRNTLRIGNAYLFISSKCSGSDGVEFFYAIIYQKGEVRGFRKQRWSDIEANKLFFGAPTQEELVDKIIQSNWQIQTK